MLGIGEAQRQPADDRLVSPTDGLEVEGAKEIVISRRRPGEASHVIGGAGGHEDRNRQPAAGAEGEVMEQHEQVTAVVRMHMADHDAIEPPRLHPGGKRGEHPGPDDP